MANPFDQFDKPRASAAAPLDAAPLIPKVNPFDQFDRQPTTRPAPREDILGQVGAGVVTGIPNAVTGTSDLLEKGIIDNLLFQNPATGRNQLQTVIEAWGDVFSGKDAQAEAAKRAKDSKPYQPSSGTLMKKGLDLVGLDPNDYFPAPKTAGERMARMAGEGAVTSLIPLPGAGQTGWAKLAEVAKNIFAGGVGGLSAQAAMEAAPDEWDALVGVAGGLAGGIGGYGAAAIPGAVTRAAGKGIDYLRPAVPTAGNVERLAAERVASAASDPTAAAAAIGNAPELVPGSKPTAFQASGDVGLGSLERALARGDDKFKAALLDRVDQQNQARVAALEGIEESGDIGAAVQFFRDRMRTLEDHADTLYDRAEAAARGEYDALGNRPAGEIGEAARSAIATQLKDMSAEASKLWESIDPDGTLHVETQPLVESAARIYGTMGPEEMTTLTSGERKIADIIGSYDATLPFKRFKELRTAITTAMRQAKSFVEPNDVAYRRLTQLRQAIETSVENSVSGKFARDASIADEFVRQAKQWYEARTKSAAAPAGDVTPPGAVPDAVPRASAAVGASGETRAPASEPRAPEGDTGLPQYAGAELEASSKAPINARDNYPVDDGSIVSLDPNEIGVDARRFQFKEGGDEQGVTERLQGVEKWDPRLAGTSLVFRDADGKDWIADGHQRTGLARRLMAEGHPPIRINAFLLDAKNGFTDAEARAIAAIKNVAEGTGTPVDAAKVMRAAKETGIDLPPLPPRSALVRDGRALAELSPDAFGMVINDVVPAAYGAIVGRMVKDPLQQEEAVRLIAQLKPDNARQVEMVVRDMLESGTEQMTRQGGLFGEEAFASSVTLERAKIADEALKLLKQDKKLFATLVNQADSIEGSGNRLARETNEARLTTDEKASDLLTQLAFRAGPVSDELSRLARDLKAGRVPANAAARDFLGAIRGAVEKGLDTGDGAGGVGARAVGEGEAEAVTPRDPDTQEMFQAAPPVGSKAFERWFGDSKVVDAEGKPLVVYHGTDQSFDAFEADGLHFFTDNRLGADTYGPNVIEAYVSLKNPMVISAGGANWSDFASAQERAIVKALNSGHDGLIIRNIRDDLIGEGEPSTSYVAFEPNQIKSTANRGTFDPNSANIFEQHGLDIYRDVDGTRVQFDDEVQAKVFDLGRDLARLNRVEFDDAATDAFPRSIRFGPFHDEVRALMADIGPYIDSDGPVRNLGDFARLAMQSWGSIVDEAAGKAGRGTMEAPTLIYADEQRAWNQKLFEGLRKEFLESQKAGRKPKVSQDQLALFQSAKPAPWREGEMFGGFETERGLEGLPQTVIPGVKPVTDTDRMSLAAAKPLKGGDAPPPKGGLFDDDSREMQERQGSLFQGEPGGIRDTMAERFAAAGRPAEEAVAAAELVDAFYTTMAERLGRSVDDLVGEHPLPQVKKGGAGGDQGTLFQPAYHGSPHVFDKFSADKIGTGEGAQAFGHGLYFAGKKDVADFYRNALAGNKVKINGKEADEVWFATAPADEVRAIDRVVRDGSIDKAIASLEQMAGRTEVMQRGRYLNPARWLQKNRDAISIEKSGRLYKVDIPDDADMLSWEKPIREMSPKVKAALNKVGRENIDDEPMVNGETLGAWEIKRFADTPEVGSEFIRKALLETRSIPAAIKKFRAEMSPYVVKHSERMLEGLEGAKVSFKKFDIDDAFGDLTGEQFYNSLMDNIGRRNHKPGTDRYKFGDPVAASNALREAGIPGHTFLDQASRPNAGRLDMLRQTLRNLESRGAGQQAIDNTKREIAEAEKTVSNNYVIYDDSKVNITGYEQRKGAPRGRIDFTPDGSVISIFDGADASTALHEAGHHFLRMFRGFAEGADVPESLARDWAAAKAWWDKNAQAVAKDAGEGVTATDVRRALRGEGTGNPTKDIAIDRGFHEQWARGFEQYLREGKAPNGAMRAIFQQFKDWLTTVYRSALGLNVNITPEVRGIFDRMLATEAAPAKAPRMMDRPAAERFSSATAATREIKDVFGAKPVKQMLKRPGPTYPYDMSAETVAANLFKPGPEGANAIKAARRAGAPVADIEAAAVASLKRAAGKDGVLDPAKLDAWRQKHGDALREVPGLERRLSSARAATEAMADIAERRRAAIDQVQKSALGRLLKIGDDGDAPAVLGRMLGRDTAVKDMRQLAREAGGDPNAIAGLRRALVEHMVGRLKTPKDALRADTFQRYLGRNAPALSQVLSPEQMSSLRAIAQDLKRATKDVRAPGGGSDTAENLAARGRYGVGQPSIIGQIVRRAIGSGATGIFTHLLAGPVAGAVSGVASFLGGTVLQAFREAGIRRVDDLVRAAILDPELMRVLLMKAPKKKDAGSSVPLRQALTQLAVNDMLINVGDREKAWRGSGQRERPSTEGKHTGALAVRG